jgi:hypothetical protein
MTSNLQADLRPAGGSASSDTKTGRASGRRARCFVLICNEFVKDVAGVPRSSPHNRIVEQRTVALATIAG